VSEGIPKITSPWLLPLASVAIYLGMPPPWGFTVHTQKKRNKKSFETLAPSCFFLTRLQKFAQEKTTLALAGCLNS
jgi:hypothetical protein